MPGSTALVKGTGFSKRKSRNVVYFGPHKAVVQRVKGGTLTVVIPARCERKEEYGVLVPVNGRACNTWCLVVK